MLIKDNIRIEYPCFNTPFNFLFHVGVLIEINRVFTVQIFNVITYAFRTVVFRHVRHLFVMFVAEYVSKVTHVKVVPPNLGICRSAVVLTLVNDLSFPFSSFWRG